ncbi:oxidoreductase, short chain dehydrogenase/reductase family [Richelia sinica FACHB-800]|uniref:3-dehydrosphinganine reductase n=1 Tax=Richelia sinica FACHB-800 TaxID=1357546 RepID=A0A975Y769_9NOST|nr:SDR family oxidoreductase [Richelia sinica]MBD2667281.1 SDR family oxidoreductase [Richelia sinica FACHB-800]QXE26026.1 oxidoreductase, short chain dehydrogenase/reductase family [Richelia sinica FACHB-800]
MYKHAIITGGSSGIGKAIATLLIQTGAHVSIIARNQTKLNSTQAELEALKTNSEQQILAISADISHWEQAEKAIAKAITELGSPDLLITSAGIAHPGYFTELPLNIFEETMAINYFGTLYSIKAALPSMIEQRKGHIVLISSGAGLIGLYGYTPYSPSKFAVRGLAESLRGELKTAGLHISIVYPPDTDTPQLAAENQTKPPETKLITQSAQMMTAEQVAIEILQAIYRKVFVITPGLEMSLLMRLHSLISPLLQWYFDSIVTKLRQVNLH